MGENKYTKEQYDKLPKDVKNSLEKLKIIIEIINNNCIKGKDYTISKLLEKFNTLQAASKIFSKYYLIENISISRYILELRKVKLTKCQPIIPIIDIEEIISNVISIYHNLNELQEKIKIPPSLYMDHISKDNSKSLEEKYEYLFYK